MITSSLATLLRREQRGVVLQLHALHRDAPVFSPSTGQVAWQLPQSSVIVSPIISNSLGLTIGFFFFFFYFKKDEINQLKLTNPNESPGTNTAPWLSAL